MVQQLQVQDGGTPTRTISIATNGSLGASYSLKLPDLPLPTITTGAYQVLSAQSITGSTIQLGWNTVPLQWLLTGNAGTIAWDGSAGNFAGTTDANAFVLGTRSASGGAIKFFTKNTERWRVVDTGNFVLGGTSILPNSRVVNCINIMSADTGILNNFIIDSYASDSANEAAQFVTRRSRGTVTSPANSNNGDDMGGMKIRGYYNGNYIECIQVDPNATSNPTVNGVPSNFNINVDGGTGMYARIAFNQDGQMGINDVTDPNATCDINGDFSLRSTAITLSTSTANNNDINVGTYSFIRVTTTRGAGSTITGISGGQDGKMLVIYNTTSNNLTLANESGSSSAANRITTTTGANIATSGTGNFTLIYDANSSRWIVTSYIQ